METIILPKVENERPLARVVAFLSALPRNKAWRVRIDQLKGDRSEHQNNALWGVAYTKLSEHTGYRADELHTLFCKKFFGTRVVELAGESVEFPNRTTTTGLDGKRDVISWDQFSEFYATIQQAGDAVGCFIPDPDRHLRSR